MMNKLIITDIQPTKQGRYSLFSQGEFLFAVDKEALVKYKIHLGVAVDLPTLQEMLSQDALGKAQKKAFDILSYREHSTHEMKEKLLRFFPEEICDTVIEKLITLDLLNDVRFCTLYLSELMRKKKFPQKALGYALKQKGLDPYLIEDCLCAVEIDDEETVKERILKKYANKLGEDAQRKKVQNALLRLGFSWQTIQSGISLAIEELEETHGN